MINKKRISKILLVSTLSLVAFSACIYTCEKAHAYSYTPASEHKQADDHFNKGKAHLSSGQYAKAIAELTQALKLDPNNSAARNNLSVAYTSRGTYLFNQGVNTNKAVNDFRAALYYLRFYGNSKNITPTIQENISITEENLKNILISLKHDVTPGGRFKKAKELRGQGDFIQAVVEFNYALEDPGLKKESYESLGDIMRVLQRDYDAAVNYDKALALDSKNPTLHLKFARVLYKLGNVQAAVSEYNIALKDESNNKEIIPILERIWRKKLIEDENDAIAHMNLGAILQKKGDAEAAMQEYRIAEKLTPQNPAIRLNMATLFQQQGDYEMAVRAYDSILKIQPDNSNAHYYKACALRKMGKIKPAIASYEATLRHDPKNKNAKAELFDTISKDLPKDESLMVLATIANNNPTDPSIQYNLAYQLHKNGKNDEALNYYIKAINLAPKMIDAYINVATIYKNKSMNEMALANLSKALDIDPDNAKVKGLIDEISSAAIIETYELATQKYNMQNFEGALQDYLSIENPGFEVYLGIGACYQALKQYDKAIEVYNKAIALNDANSTAYYYLGLAHQAKKNLGEAEANYKKAKSLDSTNKEIDEALHSLALAKNDILLNEGLNQYNEQKYQEALKILNRVITTDSENGYAYYYRAMVHDALRKFSLAIRDYEKAVNYSKDLKIAYYALAVDYDMMSNKIEALKAFRVFLDRSQGVDDEYTKYAKQRVEELTSN